MVDARATLDSAVNELSQEQIYVTPLAYIGNYNVAPLLADPREGPVWLTLKFSRIRFNYNILVPLPPKQAVFRCRQSADAISGYKMSQKMALWYRGSARTPHLQCSSGPLAGFEGPLRGRKGREDGREKKERRQS